ncbi:hypothetical protein ACIZ1P_04510 [Pseudomonas guariconensis]|uniref:hypothetical protein n=1 Tax=Pseudomonas guariconensis TaxID=1288410 RepID=UPI003F693C70
MSVWSEIFSGAVGALVVIAVQKGVGYWADRRDSQAIYQWLESESKIPGSPDYRSTRAIASNANLTEERVRQLCSVDTRIHLSTGTNPDLWTLNKSKRDPQHQIF